MLECTDGRTAHCFRTVQVTVCVCISLVCALSEGAGCLQRLWLFSIRNPEDGEDHPGQTELGSAHGHSTGLPAHRTSITPSHDLTFPLF